MKSIKKQITCIFLCAIFSLFITPQLGAQQDVPQEVIKAAQEGLPSFLESLSQKIVTKNTSSMLPVPDSAIPSIPSLKVTHGFNEDDPLDEAYLGEPFKLYLLTNDAILNYTKDSNVTSVLSQTDEWYFPVMIGEEAKSILKVAKLQGSWQAGSFGMGEAAVELGKIRKQWPIDKGYTPLLVECYAASGYLFTVPQYDSKNLTVITPPWMIMKGEEADKDYSKLEDLDSVIEELKSKIE